MVEGLSSSGLSIPSSGARDGYTTGGRGGGRESRGVSHRRSHSVTAGGVYHGARAEVATDRYIPSPSERDVNKRLAIKNKSGEEYIRQGNYHVQHVCTEERTSCSSSSSSSGAGDRWCRRLPDQITGLWYTSSRSLFYYNLSFYQIIISCLLRGIRGVYRKFTVYEHERDGSVK